MNKKKVRDVDIFQRTLCCNPIREKENEIEIFESEATEFEEDAEELIVSEDEKLDIKQLMEDLDCMKRRIQLIQLRLKLPTDECPEEECLDYEVLLNCSKNKEICTLQKNQHMLQHQIKELVKCNKIAKEQIKVLQLNMCEKNNEILELRELVKTLMEWKNTLDHEFGKCLERFEYLKHVKAEWRDVNEKIEEQNKCLSTFKESFVGKACFLQEKKSFIDAINEIKEMLKELFQYQFERFASLEQRLQKGD
ncbi:hypothetical protein FF38_02380 [Lucilia cuprina]|uniref:Uncharacterized protein n=1 Tax=Lucilia cuprina TaxID=7375 RepID=A0A0L0CAS4_LUCCU|nr:hypothetical protein CVS40_9457 [Lucilia cuprina]KNC29335.1 hypothetical protein FF38_02380 [Lucilia cuprina]